MPTSDTTQFRVVLHRIGPLEGMFDAPGFSVLIEAKDAEDAIRQAEELAGEHDGQFRVVDVHPTNGTATSARSE
jgi:hypothetical protein